MKSNTENIAYPIPASLIQVAVAEPVLSLDYSEKSQFTCRKDNA